MKRETVLECPLTMLSYIRGNLLLLSFYIQHLCTIRSLPAWMRNPDSLKKIFASNHKKGSFSLSLPAKTALDYNSAMDEMKKRLRGLHSDSGEVVSYKTTLFLLMLLRFCCIYTAVQGQLAATLILASGQFLLAPYSWFVSLAYLLTLLPPIYACHYISFFIITSLQSIVAHLTSLILPSLVMIFLHSVSSYLYLPVTSSFLFLFFYLDQAACFYYHLCSQPLSKQTLPPIFWGFLLSLIQLCRSRRIER